MKKLLDWLLGKRGAKEKLKSHPKHISCDYGIENFNQTKRSKEFLDEIRANKGHGKPQPPPTTQPPPSSTNPPAVVYLNFDGGVCSGTAWNVSGDIIFENAGLTLDEQQQVLNLVSALFSGYNVKVTADPSVYLSAARKIEVNLTQSWEWYGQAGGVAFIGSMFDMANTPCWVFTSLLGYSVSHIGEAATHEPGHTVGLRHQSSWDSACIKTAEYNKGNGVNSPIMGYPYALPPIWWKGTSSLSCTDIQDDSLILTTKLQ